MKLIDRQLRVVLYLITISSVFCGSESLACPKISAIQVDPLIFCYENSGELTFTVDWSEEGRAPWDDNKTWEWQIRKKKADGTFPDWGQCVIHPESGGEATEGGMTISKALSEIDGGGFYQIRVRALGQWTDEEGVVHTAYAANAWSDPSKFYRLSSGDQRRRR